jgi:hypothetical protein
MAGTGEIAHKRSTELLLDGPSVREMRQILQSNYICNCHYLEVFILIRQLQAGASGLMITNATDRRMATGIFRQTRDNAWRGNET